MIRRLARYVSVAYPPKIQLPFMISWAIGLTALFAAVTGTVSHWHPGGGLAITTVTLVVDMLLLRGFDDLRDHEYDRVHNPGRPLPSGLVRERDLVALATVGGIGLLLLNVDRGVALFALMVQLAYAVLVMVVLDLRLGWPAEGRLGLQLVLNLPIQMLLSAYVYVGFLRAQHQHPNAVGAVAIVAVTLAALCLELGRKATHRPKQGERTYVTVLGPAGTSMTALAAAAAATLIVLLLLRPWHSGSAEFGWAWLVLLPLLLPAVAAARFAAGAIRWPVNLVRAYIPVMYVSFLAVGWVTKGGL